MHLVEDREIYERIIAVSGNVDDCRAVLYRDPKTDEIGGLDKIIEKLLSKDNPLLKYLHELDAEGRG